MRKTVLCGREKSVYLSLSDRRENRVTEGGEGRGKMCQSENMREMKKKQIKNKRVYVNVTLRCNVKTALQISSFRAVCQLKTGFNSAARPA